MRQSSSTTRNVIWLAIFLIGCVGFATCDRQSSARRIDPNGGKFKSPCGSSDEIAKRIGDCIGDIMQLVEGNFTSPNNDSDLLGHCDRFGKSERCVRAIAKDCLSGLHKTAVSAVASAMRRFRQQECKTAESRGRYKDPLICAIRRGKDMAGVFRNHTAITQAIRDLPDVTPEAKFMKVCCVLNNLDKETESVYNKDCPKSTPLILGLIHSITDDARSTLCIAPKCNNALNKLMSSKYQPPEVFIEPVVHILFTLNSSE